MSLRILVIGCGLSGLTTALRLVSQGFQVSLIDGKSLVPGETHQTTERIAQSSFVVKESSEEFNPLDMFPLVLHGFHQATRNLLEELGTSSYIQHSTSSPFEFLRLPKRTVRFRPFPAPSPFHTVFGLLMFRGLPARDRWLLVNVLEKLWERKIKFPSDLDQQTADGWLAYLGQSEKACREVWNPLCRFFLGDPLTSTSAGSFSTILERCFLSTRSNLRITIPSLAESHLLSVPLTNLLMAKGVSFLPPRKVTQVQFDKSGVSGVKLQDGTTLTADRYVSAIPAKILLTCLPERILAKFSYFFNLTKLIETPALVVHLRLPRPTTSPRLLLSSKTFHWITTRPDSQNQGTNTIVSCVATGRANLLEQPDHDIIEQALAGMRDGLFPHTPGPTRDAPLFQIFRQPSAFLSAKPGMSMYRPIQKSPIPNLYLAGAWTDTGLPASRESSVVSGNLCAQAIAKSR